MSRYLSTELLFSEAKELIERNKRSSSKSFTLLGKLGLDRSILIASKGKEEFWLSMMPFQDSASGAENASLDDVLGSSSKDLRNNGS